MFIWRSEGSRPSPPWFNCHHYVADVPSPTDFRFLGVINASLNFIRRSSKLLVWENSEHRPFHGALNDANCCSSCFLRAQVYEDYVKAGRTAVSERWARSRIIFVFFATRRSQIFPTPRVFVCSAPELDHSSSWLPDLYTHMYVAEAFGDFPSSAWMKQQIPVRFAWRSSPLGSIVIRTFHRRCRIGQHLFGLLDVGCYKHDVKCKAEMM